MSHWQSDKISLVSRTSHILNTDLFSDVQFSVGPGGTEFAAHKLLLCLASPVFEHRFYQQEQNMASTDLSIMRVPDIMPHAFFKMLKYIYTDLIEINNVEEAHDVLEAAEKFKLSHLQQLCQNYIKQRELSADKVCKMYEIACDLDMVDVRKMCLYMFQKHTAAVLKSDYFLNIKLSTLLTIVMNKSPLCNEMTVLNAVMKWSLKEIDRRNLPPTNHNIRKSVEPILKHIQFLSLSMDEFEEFLSEWDILTANEVFEITRKIAQPDGSSFLSLSLSNEQTSKSLSMTSSSKKDLSLYHTETQKFNCGDINDSEDFLMPSSSHSKSTNNPKQYSVHSRTANNSMPSPIHPRFSSNCIPNSVHPRIMDDSEYNSLPSPVHSGLKNNSIPSDAPLKSTDNSESSSKLSSDISRSMITSECEHNISSAHSKIRDTFEGTSKFGSVISRVMNSHESSFKNRSSHSKMMTGSSKLCSVISRVMETPESISTTSSIHSDNVDISEDRGKTSSARTRERKSPNRLTKVPSFESISNHSSSQSDYTDCESDSEASSSTKWCKTCEISLKDVVLPNGIMIVDISSHIHIEMKTGRIRIIGFVLQLKKDYRKKSDKVPFLIQVSKGIQCIEEAKNVVFTSNQSHMLLKTPIVLEQEESVKITVSVDSIQLKRCSLCDVCDFIVRDEPIEFNVKVSSDQKSFQNEIPFLVKNVLYNAC